MAKREGLPKATYKGVLKLGAVELDCYVLADGRRMVASRAAVKAIAGTESGDLGSILPAGLVAQNGPSGTESEEKGRKNKSDFGGAKVVFEPPLRGSHVHGLTAEGFVEICQAYVTALSTGRLRTERQREIALQCAVLLGALAKTGLVALIDEATGYQKLRDDTALSLKFAAYLSEKLRPWSVMFPDDFWLALHRVFRFQGPARERPKYYAQVVERVVYRSLDPDLVKHLKTTRPPSMHGIRWHQWFNEDLGAKALREHIGRVTALARVAKSRLHLYDLVDEAFSKDPAQITLYLPPPPSGD